MEHLQDCCESVEIEDVCGDVEWMVRVPILSAEETSNHRTAQYASSTWTFYRITTFHGTVTIRWLGTSNGYYSESVTFTEVTS